MPANQKTGIRSDDPAKFLVTCGNPDGSPTYFKYLLRPPVIVGTDISAASSEEDLAGLAWQLQLTFKPMRQARGPSTPLRTLEEP